MIVSLQYTRDFQIKLLTNLMADEKFFADTVGLLHLTDFDLPACRLVFEIARAYYQRHKTLPPVGVLFSEVELVINGVNVKYETMLQQTEHQSLTYVLESVSRKSPTDIAVPYYKDELTPFLMHVRMAQAHESCGSDPQAMIEATIKISDELRQVSSDDITFVNAMDPIPETTASGVRSGTGVFKIDQFINNGLERKQMGMLVACTGVGKTCGLINFATNTALHHKYGLFITLELPALKIVERYQGILVHFDAELFTQPRHLWTPDVKWRMDYATSAAFPYRNNITVYDASVRATSVAEIEKIIIKWKAHLIEKQGLSEDDCIVVYVDWLEKISSEGVRGITRNTNEAMAFKLILEALGEVARRQNVAIWTATQATRAAVGREVLDITHTAHSVHAHDPLDISMGLAPVAPPDKNLQNGVIQNEDTWQTAADKGKTDKRPPCNRFMNCSFFKTRYSSGVGKTVQFYQGATLRFWDTQGQHGHCSKIAQSLDMDGMYAALSGMVGAPLKE